MATGINLKQTVNMMLEWHSHKPQKVFYV